MILTGKAKEDFLKWTKQGNLVNIMADVYLHALIIEWFDSVGIYIEVDIWHREKYKMYFGWHVSNFNGCIRISHDKEQTSSRQESTKQAILRANQIYNESKN